MDSLCLFTVLRYIFLRLEQIKTTQPKKSSASPCCITAFLVLSIYSFSGMVHSPFLVVFCTVFIIASCISVYTFTFLILFLHAFSCQPYSLILYCEKESMQKRLHGFVFWSYPYHTVLRNKAGIEKAGFQKPLVSESCQTRTANCNFIQ